MKIMRILLRCKMIKESCELYGASVIWTEISWILNLVANTRIQIFTSKNFIRIIVDFCFKIVNILYRIQRRAYKISSLFVLLFCKQIDQNSINSQSTKRQSFLKQKLKIEIKCEFPSWKLNKKKDWFIYLSTRICPYGYKWKQTLRIHCKIKSLKIIFKCSKTQNTWIRICQNPTEFWKKQIATKIAVCAILNFWLKTIHIVL